MLLRLVVRNFQEGLQHLFIAMSQQAGFYSSSTGYVLIAAPHLTSVAGNPRKASTDVNARAVDDPKRAGKARKGHGSHAQPADI